MPLTAFVLSEDEPSIANMLPAELNQIAPPLARVERQSERQTGSRAHGMLLFKLPNLRQRPRMVALGVGAQKLHVCSRIEVLMIVSDGEAEELPKRLHHTVAVSGVAIISSRRIRMRRGSKSL